jgi:hypothetical protein
MHKTEVRLHEAKKALKLAEAGAEADAKANGGTASTKWRVAIEQAKRELYNAELVERYGHKQGTPETYARIDAVPKRQRQGALARMAELGTIDIDEFAAACEIAAVAEMIESNVGVRASSVEARVDGSGSARDVLVEALGRVRAEMTYTIWRQHIPMPRAMILDMVVRDLPYVAVSRAYRLNYRTARKRLISALRMWMEISWEVRRTVTTDEVLEVYQRLGDGVLLAPKPRNEEAA